MVILVLRFSSQIAFKIRIAGYVKMMVMKVHKSLHFLKPRLINVLLTFFVLCLPILREQYNNGQYVTYYRPITVIIDYFQHFQQPHLLLIMAIFILLVYFVVSSAIASVYKFILPVFKNLRLK